MNTAETEINTWTSRAFGGSNRKLAMWLFILSDSLTFAALLLSYVYLRVVSGVWPRPFSFSPEILFAALMTLCLLASSWTMVNAVSASAHGQQARKRRWILFTIIAGVIFIALHLIEWNRLLGEFGKWNYELEAGFQETRPASWSADASHLFGGVFFTITGFHLLHVLSGVIYLAVTAMRRNASHESIELCGLYWQFVDAVWLIIFPAIYLFSVK